MPEKKNRNQLLLEKYIKEEKEGKNFKLNKETISRFVNKYKLENPSCFEEMRAEWTCCLHNLREVYEIGYKVAVKNIRTFGLTSEDITKNLESLSHMMGSYSKINFHSLLRKAQVAYALYERKKKRIDPFYKDIMCNANYRIELKRNKKLDFVFLRNGLKKSFELGYLTAIKEYIDKYIKLLEEYPYVLEFLQNHKRFDKGFGVLYPVTSNYVFFNPEKQYKEDF